MQRRKIMSNKKKQELHLDPEEQAVLDSFENGEWQSVKKLKVEKSKARQAAANYLRKGARINIRISETDLQQIKQKAAHEGLPYQTLIASILHKYAAGHS
jgi:predicted DNA binding CopG/RHH family protein